MKNRIISLSILVAALGYFVDIYDILLFNVVRIPSLLDIGVPQERSLDVGVYLFNMQMIGMLIGGILWGVLADKRGRLSVLYGSILMYSLANIANGFVHSVSLYALLRFIAGVGLAGELGAGITLVSEVMNKEKWGYGTLVVASVGVLGGVVASYVGTHFPWRTAYFIGGAMGLMLLLLRIGVRESGMFQNLQSQGAQRGNLQMLFSSKRRALKYLNCILIGLPIWCVVAIFITFSPELGKALGMSEPPKTAAGAVMWCYIGLAFGDFGSGYLSQVWRSRKKIMALFMALTACLVVAYCLSRGISAVMLNALCFGLGLFIGYWAVFVTNAAEQFGTDIRATVTTTVPNFVRGAVVPLTLAFKAIAVHIGLVGSAALVTLTTIAIGLFALHQLDETYGKELEYTEVAQ